MPIRRSILLLVPFWFAHFAVCLGEDRPSDHLQGAHAEWISFVGSIRGAHPSLATFASTYPVPALRDVLFVPANARELHIRKEVWRESRRVYQYRDAGGAGVGVGPLEPQSHASSIDLELPPHIPHHYLDITPFWSTDTLFDGVSNPVSKGHWDVVIDDAPLSPFGEPEPQKRYLDLLEIWTDAGTSRKIDRTAIAMLGVHARPVRRSDRYDERSPLRPPRTDLVVIANRSDAKDQVTEEATERVVDKYLALQRTKNRLEQDLQNVEEALILLASHTTARINGHLEKHRAEQEEAIRVYEASSSQNIRGLAASARTASINFDADSVKQAINSACQEALVTVNNSCAELKSVTEEIKRVLRVLDSRADALGISRTDLIDSYAH